MVSFGSRAGLSGAGLLMLGVGVAGPVTSSAKADAQADPEPQGDPYGPERDAWVILTSVDRLGPVAFAALLARFGSSRTILVEAREPGGVTRLTETPALDPVPDRHGRRPVPMSLAVAIAEAAEQGHHVLDLLQANEVRAVTVEEPLYPTRLAMIEMPPHVLFIRGSITALGHHRAVAVVGTRRATSSGRAIAGRIATALVGAEAAVISGLAYGIDGAAHDATIRAGGSTVAVIGGGHAVATPTGHHRLARAILDSGGAIVSELVPDVEPTHGTFPRRNRIISGLADATVVVEAPARSGALITASWALEQGRDCFLVPGSLDAATSAGCLGFLREFPEASRVVAGVPQLMADLGFGAQPVAGAVDAVARATLQDLGQTGREVAAALIAGLATVDELVAVTDLPVASVLASLALLERRGLAAGLHGRYRPAGSLLGERVTPRPR